MAPINMPPAGAPRRRRPALPEPRPAAESPAAVAPSPRRAAGALAPASLAPASAPAASTPAVSAPAAPAAAAPAAGPHFEKRTVSAPEIPGVREMADLANADGRPPHAVLADLRQAREHFAGIRAKGKQTNNEMFDNDGARTHKLIKPILNAENARSPGLNAVGFASEEKMVEFLRIFSSPIRDGQEGHIRCHVGFGKDTHRAAVDAFKHEEGGFTLVVVDSGMARNMKAYLKALERNHSDLIKGILYIPTPNQVHIEGCRIFAVHSLNALHDFQPHIQGLHRQIYDRGRGRPAPGLSGPEWKHAGGNHLGLDSVMDAFTVLPLKFFKHMQVMRPKPGQTITQLGLAEKRNPALESEPVNKQGQTLRERIASQNPRRALDQFSRADRTASIDNKRLVLIDRAIAHYEKQYGKDGYGMPPGRRFRIGNGWY